MDLLISKLVLQDEALNIRVDHFIEVSDQLWKGNIATAVEIDTCEDLLGLILSHIDLHHLKGIKELGAVDLVGLVLINSPKQVMNSLLGLIKGSFNLVKDALLVSNNVISDASPLSILLSSATRAFILHHDFVFGEYAEEVLIINTCCLISPEVVYERVELVFVESEVAHVLEHVLEIIPADVASIVLVN